MSCCVSRMCSSSCHGLYATFGGRSLIASSGKSATASSNVMWASSPASSLSSCLRRAASVTGLAASLPRSANQLARLLDRRLDDRRVDRRLDQVVRPALRGSAHVDEAAALLLELAELAVR